MGLSIELLDALDAAQEACKEALEHLAQYNSRDRHDEAGTMIANAFTVLTEAIKTEPHRASLTEWRTAVAKGETQQGYEEWKTLQANMRTWRSDQ